MKHGRVDVELVKLRNEIADCDVVHVRAARKRGAHPENDVKSEQNVVSDRGTDAEFVSPFLSSGEFIPEICWKSVPRLGKLGKKWSRFMVTRLPDLGRWTVRIGGRETYEIHVEIFVPSSPDKRLVPISESEEPAASRQPEEEQRAAEKGSKIAPRKPKRSSRPVKREATPPDISEPPKPLKVIRRRGEQAQKVFETPPMMIPQAMLEGIQYQPDDDPDT